MAMGTRCARRSDTAITPPIKNQRQQRILDNLRRNARRRVGEWNDEYSEDGKRQKSRHAADTQMRGTIKHLMRVCHCRSGV
jgi:hypothetical protein